MKKGIFILIICVSFSLFSPIISIAWKKIIQSFQCYHLWRFHAAVPGKIPSRARHRDAIYYEVQETAARCWKDKCGGDVRRQTMLAQHIRARWLLSRIIWKCVIVLTTLACENRFVWNGPYSYKLCLILKQIIFHQNIGHIAHCFIINNDEQYLFWQRRNGAEQIGTPSAVTLETLLCNVGAKSLSQNIINNQSGSVLHNFWYGVDILHEVQSAKYPAYSCKIPLSPRKLRNADRIHKPKDPYVGHHSFREAVIPLLLLDLLSCGRKNWVIAIVIAGRECVCVSVFKCDMYVRRW